MTIEAHNGRMRSLEEALLDRIGKFEAASASFDDLIRMASTSFPDECSAAAVARTLDMLLDQKRIAPRLRLVGGHVTYDRLY